MCPALLITALQLTALSPPPDSLPPDNFSVPHPPLSSRWLPTVTLRVAYRGQRTLWLESTPQSFSLPTGWTFELRLSWGLSPLSSSTPSTSRLTTEPSP